MNEEHEVMIDDCINRKHDLTDWELKFVENLTGPLSENESYILNHVWDRVT